MEWWLEFLRGPVFRFALLLGVLGLLRELLLGVWGASTAYYKANDKNVPWGQLIVQTLGWLIPVKRLFTSERKLHGVLSFLFHVGVILAPLFLLDHLLLWSAGLNLKFLAMSKSWSDGLTLLTIAACAGLILSRAFSHVADNLSGFQDYFLLLLFIVIFATGFGASRPWNPISYTATMVIHVAAADLSLLLLPFTKLAHVTIFPVLRLTGELGWKFPARTGEEVALTIDGKEVRPI